jgi:tRNA (guanine-N7-)-methyltransferase
MKSKMLKFPFTWEHRKPHLDDRMLYVPKFYDKHDLWSPIAWNNPEMFGNDNDLCIEFCSGNGAWILEKAKAHPLKNWVAVEKRFDRASKIWARMKNTSVTNVLVVCGEAEPFADHYVNEDAFSEIYINFPDPWPKERHAKNRIFRQPFIKRVSQIAKKDAKATFVTDDEVYSLQMIEEMSKSGAWKSTLPDPQYVTDWPQYGSSYFDELWRAKGKTIRYMQFSNTKATS